MFPFYHSVNCNFLHLSCLLREQKSLSFQINILLISPSHAFHVSSRISPILFLLEQAAKRAARTPAFIRLLFRIFKNCKQNVQTRSDEKHENTSLLSEHLSAEANDLYGDGSRGRKSGGMKGERGAAQTRLGEEGKKRGEKNPSRENFLKRMNSIYHTDGAQ